MFFVFFNSRLRTTVYAVPESSMTERAGDDGQTRKKKDGRTQSAVGRNELLCWTMLRSGRDHWLDLTRRHKALKAWHK